MDPRKDIIDELKKYNKDLEKHMPNLELDFLKDINTSKKSNDNDEYFSLLANNLMELRTEVALTRKNLTTEIEGMVLRTINNQQNKFFDQIKKFYGVIIMEIKDNFTTHLQSMNDEMNGLKRKYNDIYMQNENFSNLLDEILVDVKDIRNDLDDLGSDSRNMNNLSKKKFEEFFEKLELATGDINRKKNYFEENLIKINKKFSKIEHMLEELGDEGTIQKSPHINSDDIDEAFVKEIQEAAKNKELPLPENNGRKSRLFDINEKLEKLNSLR